MKFFGKASTSTMRVRLEDALKHLLDCDESGRGATVDSLAGALTRPRGEAAEILGQLRGRGLATATGDAHQLTEDGRLYALQVVRTHRLYETWLARETSTPAVDWHREAHKAEHHLEAEAVDAMADRLNNPRFDPHGDPIPTREGEMPRRLLDLGVVPGTRIRCAFASPFGTPRSYDIRGALIALRDHQAERILIHQPVATTSA